MAQIRIPSDALVLVGDGRKALFLRNRGSAAQPRLETERVLEQDNPATRDQGADRPGRRADNASHVSAMSETDWHQLGEQRFAAEVAETLYRARHAGRYHKLVVIAPPATLGVLRKTWHKEVAESLIAECPKDLTGQDLGSIERWLTGSG